MGDELIEYDAVSLGGLIRKGEIKPIELIEITIQRIERVNPKLNCVIHKMYDQAYTIGKQWNDRNKKKQIAGSLFGGWFPALA